MFVAPDVYVLRLWSPAAKAQRRQRECLVAVEQLSRMHADREDFVIYLYAALACKQQVLLHAF